MKTEPIGFDYYLPVWVARGVAVVAGAALLFFGWLAVMILVQTPHKWFAAVRTTALGVACLVVIQRALKVIPRLRDDRFQDRIEKFKAMKQQPWHDMLEQLVSDPEVELLNEAKVTMANPFSWGTKQGMITARSGDLVAVIFESSGRVGTIRFELVVQ
jgi:hypothetical protein